jgi:hypothetical protein
LWSTFGAVTAGEAFSRRARARAAWVNRTSELVLADFDWTMTESWARAERAQDLGYRLEMIDGMVPEHLRADAAPFHHIMQTAPYGCGRWPGRRPTHWTQTGAFGATESRAGDRVPVLSVGVRVCAQAADHVHGGR